jgi:CheY-like chemotaxis protein
MRVLVVDDEAFAADTLAMLLRGRGHEVIVAHDGATGIAIGVAGAIDAAVVDLGLGRVDGYAVANELRAHYGTHLTLIAYTGYSRVEVQLRAQENGFNRVILKPATVESIVAALSASQE